MKREIAKYVSECDTCQRIKADHLRPVRNLQPLSIPEWKWENICMDFIVGLPRTFESPQWICHFDIKENLALRYIGLYPIIDKYVPTSYQVELPAKLSGVHNVFHVSQLKRCLKPLTDVVIEDTITLEPDLTYKTYPIKILYQQDRVTRNKTTQFYKIQWNEHSEDESTWKCEDLLRVNYPEFLPSR
jgi:hypothetical protein